MSAYMIVAFVVVLFFLITMSAIFSAAETAYSSVSRALIEIKVRQRRRSALLIRKHYQHFGWTVATILISNNVVNIAASSLTTYMLSQLLSASLLVTIISTVVLTPILVGFGEIMPKLLAKRFSYPYLSLVVYLIEFFNWLLFPLTFPLAKLALQSKITNSENELKHLLRLAHSEGVLERQEAALAQNALDLDSTNVASIMTKRDHIAFLESGLTIREAKQRFALTNHSRLPIKRGGIFTGMVLLKDVVFEDEHKAIEDFAKKIVFISKNTLATNALERMRAHQTQIALVTASQQSDSVVGLVTIEDIVEELVGEIYDEHENDLSVRQIAHYKWLANGDATMMQVGQELGIKFDSDDEAKTITHFMTARTSKKIKKNFRMTYKKLAFKVVINQKGELPLIQITKK